MKISGKNFLNLWEGAGMGCFNYSCVLFIYFLNFVLPMPYCKCAQADEQEREQLILTDFVSVPHGQLLPRLLLGSCSGCGYKQPKYVPFQPSPFYKATTSSTDLVRQCKVQGIGL